MKSFLAKLTTAAISLAALLITGSAWAVDPVAVWNGDLGTEKAGFAFALNDNTLNADGTITMSAISDAAKLGVTLRSTTAAYPASTIIFEVEGMTIPSADGAAIVSTYSSSSGYDDYCGMRVTNSGETYGIWNNNKWGNTGNCQTHRVNSAAELGAATRVALVYVQDASKGTQGYMMINGTLTKIFGAIGLVSTKGGMEVKGWNLLGAGCDTTANRPITKMAGAKLKKVAIFNSELTTDDIAAYKFPAPQEIQAFYSKWANAQGVFTWRSADSCNLTATTSTFKRFDMVSCEDTGDDIHGRDTYNGSTFWNYFAHSTSVGGYAAPGCVIRFVDGYGKSIAGDYSALALFGLIVEEGASGYSFSDNGGNRRTVLGNPFSNSDLEAYFSIGADFTFARNGQLFIAGTTTFDVAQGCVLDLNSTKGDACQPEVIQSVAEQGNGALNNPVAGGKLVLKGEGQIKATKLTASGATLDYSNLAVARDPFITGNLTIDDSTTIILPPTLAENTPFTLCSGTLTGAADCVREITMLVDGEEKTGFANLTFNGNTVSYAWPAATSEVTIDNDMSWDAVTQLTGYNATVPTTATLTKDVTITFGATATVLPLTFTGPYTATLVYEKTPSIQEIKLENNAAFEIVIPANSDYVAQSLPAGATSVEFITATGANFNFGANNFIYNYTGGGEVSPTITGTGTFTKSGSGTLGVNFGQDRTAETIVNGGVLKTTAQKALGANATITINKDGILDYNGYSNNGQPTIVLNGGTLRNTRESQPTSQMQILNLRLTSSSTIDAQMDFGLVGSSHCQTTLNLGEYTLTKDGDGQFHIVNTVVSGSGTIKVDAGSLHVSNSACTMADGTVELDGGNLGLDAAFTLNTLLVKNGAVTGNGALTLTNFKVAGTADMTARALPLTGTLTTDSTGTLKIAKPAKPTKIIAGSAIPAGLTIVDADGIAITDVCVYDGFIWYGTIGTGTYTVTTDDENALKAMADGDIYSSATLDVTLSAISGTPEGFFGWVEDHTAYFAKKSNSISLKTGARTIKDGNNQPWATSILSTDANVGGFPVAGKFWNNTKISNGNQAEVKDYMLLTDGNGKLTEVAVAYRAHNTYYAKYSGAMESGNMRLTGSYLDDNAEDKNTQYTISESSQPGVTIPDGSVTLPKAPNARGWQFEVSNIPYEMYDLYVYIASDVQDNVDNVNSHLYACPVVISCDGENWTYYAGPSKATDNDSWEAYGWAHANNVVEGKNYIRFRISKNSTGLDDISTIHITHGTRNTGTNKRLGLAGIQIVAIDDDGVRDRVKVGDGTQNWHDTEAWSKKKGEGTELVNWTDSDETTPIIARINASNIPTITMDSAATVDKLVISGTAETFTIEGEGALTATSIDATDFTGNIVFEAPVTGALSLGANAKLVVEIDDGEEISVDNLLPAGLTIASGNLTITGSGTIVCDGQLPTAYQSSFQADTWAGTVWIKNITTTPGNGWYFPNYGSKIKVTNVKGWFNYNTPFQSVDVELADEEDKTALEFTDGSANIVYGFTSISGNGTLKTSSVHKDPFVVKVGDVSNFNGKLISASAGDGTIAIPIYVGNAGTPECGTTSKITFADGATVKAGLGWEAEAVAFGNTLNVAAGAQMGDVLVSGVTAAPSKRPVVTIAGDTTEYSVKLDNGAIKICEGDVAITVQSIENVNPPYAQYSEGGSTKYVYPTDGVIKVPYGAQNVIVTYMCEDNYTFSTGLLSYSIELGTMIESMEAKVPADIAVGIAVAQINGATPSDTKNYPSLAAAVAAAADGATISMIGEDPIQATINKSITIDVNGYSVNVNATAGDGVTVNLACGGTVSGTVTVNGGAVNFQTASDGVTGSFTGTLNYVSGTVTKSNDYTVAAPADYCWNSEGTLVAAVAKIVGSDGTTTYFPTYEAAITAAGDDLASIVVLEEDPYLPDGYALDNQGKIVQAAARINFTDGYYAYVATLAEAFTQYGGTVTLCQDVVVDETFIMPAFNGTINFAGHRISGALTDAPVIRVANGTIVYLNDTAEVKGGVFNTAGDTAIVTCGSVRLQNVDIHGAVMTTSTSATEFGQIMVDSDFAPSAKVVVKHGIDRATSKGNILVATGANENVDLTNLTNAIVDFNDRKYGRIITVTTDQGYNVYSLMMMQVVVVDFEATNASISEKENLITFADQVVAYPTDISGEAMAFKFAVTAEVGYRIESVLVNGEAGRAQLVNGKYVVSALSTDAALTIKVTTAFNPAAQVGDDQYSTIAEALAALTDNTETTVTILTSQAGQTIMIPANKVVKFVNGDGVTGTAGGATIAGAGTIVYDGVLPGDEKTSYANNAWTGTVWIKNAGQTGNNKFAEYNAMASWGNENSTVRLTACNGYINGGGNFAFALELVGEESTNYLGWKNPSGSSSLSHAFKSLSGSGTLDLSSMPEGSGNPCSETWKFGSIADFSGNLILCEGTRIGKQIVVGTGNGLGGGKILIEASQTATIPAGKTWTTIETKIDGTVNAPVSTTNPFASNVTGSGTVVYDGAGSARAMPTVGTTTFNNTNWRGTVRLTGIGTTVDFHPEYYGNANSIVEFNGITPAQFPASGAFDGTIKLTDKDDGTKAWVMGNGYSRNTTGYVIAKLAGDGEYKDTKSDVTQQITINDGSEFAGALTIVGKRFVFGTTAETTGDGSIIVQAGKTVSVAANKTWTATNGIKVSGTIGGAGKIASALIFNNGAILDATTEAKLTASSTVEINGVLKVKVAEAPTGDAAVTLLNAANSGLSGDLDAGVVVETSTGAASGYYKLVAENDTIVLKVSNQPWESTETVNNNVNLGDCVVAGGNLTFDGLGGIRATSFQIGEGSKIVFDPVKTPLYVTGGTPTLVAGSIALAPSYAETTLGKVVLMTWQGGSLNLDAAALKALVKADSLKSGVDYTVEDVDYGSVMTGCRQLVLKIGDYDNKATTLKVMPLGDSITEGSGNEAWSADGSSANYRIGLMERLAAIGYKPVSLGFRTIKNVNAAGVTAPADYSWHNGISGQRVISVAGGTPRAGFRESIETLLEAAGDEVDVITFKIGTNDAIRGTPTDEQINAVVDGWTNVMWRIIRHRPTTKIVVGSILYMDANRDSYVTRYNAALKTKVEEMEQIWGANRVTFVDLNAAVPEDDLKANGSNFYDDLHPNWLGHGKMADAWLDAIKTTLATAKPTADGIDGVVEKNTKTGAESNVKNEYRKGFEQLYVLNAVTCGKFARAGEVPYTTEPEATDTRKFAKVAYYMELRHRNSGHVRYVWADMNNFTADKSIADIPVSNENGSFVVTGLHVDTNDTGIEPVALTDNSATGFIQFTAGAAGSDATSIDGAPGNFQGYDWNDKMQTGNGYAGVFHIARTFVAGGTAVDSAQMLMSYNSFNTVNNNATEIGIGNFAQHCGSGFSMNNIFTYDLSSITIAGYSVASIEIWGVPCAAEDDEGNVYDTVEEAVNALDKEVTVIADTEIDLAKVTKESATINPNGKVVRWTDANNKIIIANDSDKLVVTAGQTDNGLSSFADYVLNLKPKAGKDETPDKPYIKAAAGQSESGKIKFNFFHGTGDQAISPRDGTGVTVKYAVLTADSPKATNWTQPEGAESTEGAVTVDLPQPGAGKSAVRYFKPSFSFK